MQRKFYKFFGTKKVSPKQIFAICLAFGMFISLHNQAQDLFDVDVELTRVEWGGDVYCGDGVVDFQLPPLPAICIDLGNGVDPRFMYRVGVDGVYPQVDPITQAIEDILYGQAGYYYVGADNSPTEGGPVLDDESDTDGANVNSENHNVSIKTVCASSNLTFDLDAWEEDSYDIVDNIAGIPALCLNNNYVYNNDYSLLCNPNFLDDSDDARSRATVNVAIPGSGTNNITTNFGNYAMDWRIVATPVSAPTVSAGDFSVCSGTSASFVTNPSTECGDLIFGLLEGCSYEFAWYSNANDPAGSLLSVGNDFSTPAINSFPATYYVAKYSNGCFGAATTLTITEDLTGCDDCTAPDFLFAYNIDWSSASLGWNEVNGAERYQMEGNPKGLRFLKCTKTTTTNGVNATGLFPFLKYEFRVRTDCVETGWSAWSDRSEFELNPWNTAVYRLPENLPSADELESVRFDVSGIFVAHRDAAARTITVGYFGGEELGKGQIVLTDVAGRQVYEGAFELTPANVQQIQTGDIADGIYFVTLYKEGIVMETEKILVY